MLFTITLARTISLTSACGLSFSVPLCAICRMKKAACLTVSHRHCGNVAEMFVFLSTSQSFEYVCRCFSFNSSTSDISGQMKRIPRCPFRDLKSRTAQALLGTLSALLNFSSNIWFPHDFLPHFPHRWIPVNTFHFPQSSLSICGSPW